MKVVRETIVRPDPTLQLAEHVPSAVVCGQSLARFSLTDNNSISLRGNDKAHLLKVLRGFEDVVRDVIITLEESK